MSDLCQGLASAVAPKQTNSFLGGLKNFFVGGNQNKFNKQQQSALSQLLGMGLQGLQNPSQGFQPIADQARTQFNQQTVPSIAERFTSLGDNALSSPAFSSELGQAGSGLEGLLASLQAQYGQQQQSHFSNLLGMGLTPQNEGFQPGFLQQVLPSLGRAGVHAGAAALTGGASTGASALSEIIRMLSQG